MAIKDWKKIKGYTNGWRKEDKRLVVRPFYHYYSIELWKDGKSSSRTFKTKSQALKFAKEYMRKH